MDLHENDVIYMDPNSSLLNCASAKVRDIEDVAVAQLNGKMGSMARHGIKCELLKPGQEWVRGRIKARIVFEFEPETQSEDSFEDSHID